MDIYERRRENLRAYRTHLGNDTLLAERLGRSLSQIGQLIGLNPTRNIGNRLIREFEETLNLPAGALESASLEDFRRSIVTRALAKAGYEVEIINLPLRGKNGNSIVYLQVTQNNVTIDIYFETPETYHHNLEYLLHKQSSGALVIRTFQECETVVEDVSFFIQHLKGNTSKFDTNITDSTEDIKNYGNLISAPDIKGLVPLISWVQAGEWNGSGVDDLENEPERWMECPRTHSGRTFALRVKGESMQSSQGRSFPDGSIIFVDAEKKDPVSGDCVVARLRDSSEATFKVFMKEDNQVWLRPLNPGFPMITDQFEIIGTVIGKWEDV